MDIIDQYKKELEREGKSENTIVAYLSDINKFARWLKDTYEETFYPENITSHDIQDYKNYLISVKNLKPATVNRRLVALSKFLDWCISQEMISDNPASRVKGIKEVNTAPKALERIDIKRLVREVYKDNNIRNIAIIELLVNTGIRVGELVSLNLNDVSISPRKGLITVRQGKGESYREVPLNKNVRKAITDYLDQRPKSKSKKLFLGQRGPIKETGVWRIVKKYAEMADIEASPHMLRHTFATRLLRKHDVDIVTVSRLLGHQSINSTAIYTQPSQKDMENAVDKLTKD